MKLGIKSKNERCILIVFTVVALLPLTGFAKPKPIMTTDILQHLRKGEPWNRGVFTATKMVIFQQATNTTGGTDATSVSKITLSYFTSTDCTATNGTSVPTYTTPDGTSFSINTTTPFGMVAASAWNVGSSKVSPAVADMTQIQSIAVTFKSTNSNTPQASFTGISFACMPVTCSGGECTSGSGTQSFTLKTTAAIGDPADGGVIGCQNTGSSPNLFDLVVPAADNSTSLGWGGSGITTGATSATNGVGNTALIVAAVGTASTYAARTCSEYTTAGGFTRGWFLPSGSRTVAGNQINCLCQNKLAIGGFSTSIYWSSQESSSLNATRISFNACAAGTAAKTTLFSVRCSRAF